MILLEYRQILFYVGMLSYFDEVGFEILGFDKHGLEIQISFNQMVGT